ncbi:MAG: hotdog fold domain-containing protein [Gemmatimonadota bacterium]
MRSSPAERIADLWNRLHGLPGGRWLFSQILRLMIPYSGTVRPRVLELGPGYCRVEIRDRRRVRNHLNSVHAIALMNVGELTSGLAVTLGLPPSVRGIVRELSAEYLIKARGALTATCSFEPPAVTEEMDFRVTSEVRNAGAEVVARVHTIWRLAPRPAVRSGR